MREIIHFAHANSFPASVYRKFLATLAEQYQIGYLDAVGHDPAYPVTDGWPYLVDECIRHIEQYGRPVIGVGHSLGGVLLLYAAMRRPELFRALVILDSPLFGPLRSRTVWLAKRLGFIQKITPGGNPLRRRDSWPSVQRVREYFARKPAFARFDPDCLADYAEHGTVPDAQGGRRLKFRPLVEYQVFEGLPHDLPRYRGRLTVPTLLVVGQQSGVLKPADLAFARRHFGMQITQQAGSHLFPLEHPVETAQRIMERLPALLSPPAAAGP